MPAALRSPIGAINLAWCRTIAARLVAHGVAQAVICPGSRSAAMVMALAESGLSRGFVQADERSAAFFALGLAKRSGRPLAICTTSGSAVANVLPALAEASAAGVPLVLLSCDRPARMRGKGLPQTTEQVAICAPLLRSSLSLGDPVDSPAALARLATRVDEVAIHLLPGRDIGPIQINVPLDGSASSVEGFPPNTPLQPQDSPVLARAPPPTEGSIARLDELELAPGMRGAIVCGPDWDRAIGPDLLRQLATATGLPILADAPGSARGLGIGGTIAEGDLLAADPGRPKPDFLIRIGSAPVSHSMQDFAKSVGRVIRIDRQPIEEDFLAASFCQVTLRDAAAVDQLAAATGIAPPGWRAEWDSRAARVRTAMAGAVTEAGWSELQAVTDAIGSRFSLFQVANSLAIRLVNLLCPARRDGRLVMTNRGVSGIDGTIGTFLGAVAAHGDPGLLITGDLAAIHDIPALEACLHNKWHGAILILNNGGASLFDLLPLQAVPGYDTLVRNSVRMRFDGIAASFGLTYRACSDRSSLRDALAEAADTPGMTMIEAILPPHPAQTTLPAFYRRVLTQ